MTLEETYDSYRRSRRKHRAWAADNPGNVAIRAELLEAVIDAMGARLQGNGAVLDIGCGGGWLLERLAEKGIAEGRLYGIDRLERRVAAARQRIPGADIRRGDASSLPFGEGEVTIITMLTCLSSMHDGPAVAKALAECARVLGPGGLLLVYEPRLPNPLNRATRHISFRALRDALAPAVHELSARRLTGFPPIARRLGRLAPPLYPALTRTAPTHKLSVWLKSAESAQHH